MDKSSSGFADVAKYGTYKEFAFFDKVSGDKFVSIVNIYSSNVTTIEITTDRVVFRYH